MSICTKLPNKTSPEEGTDAYSEDPPQPCRTNGWSWPPHPLQILAWGTYFFFTVVGFGILIPLLPRHWVPAGYICTGVMYLYHLIAHLVAISVDPADDNVRAKKQSSRRPAFDRRKHAHVIENLHCYLCEVDVGPKSKHCSACNKCVSNFDHHCKWLNNCVGGRNYWIFLNSVISAALGTLLVVLNAFYVFIGYYVDPTMLRTDVHFEVLKNSTDVWFVFLPAVPAATPASTILVLAALVVILGLLTLVMLGQLLCFHIYLNWNRLSTYEYVLRQRHREGQTNDEKDQDPIEGTPRKMMPFQVQPFQAPSFPGSLMYTNHEILVKEVSPFPLRREGRRQLPKFRSMTTLNGESMLGDYEPSLSNSLELEEQHESPQKKRKKKKKRVFKVPEEVINDRSKDCSMETIPAPLPESVPAAPQEVHLPIPAYPTRSLPLLAQIHYNPIQAAGPPAAYHSDSAESMDEIPIAQTRLGTAGNVGLHNPRSILGNTRQNPIAVRQGRSEPLKPDPDQFAMKNVFLRSFDTRQHFELSPKVPTVFVIDTSAQVAHTSGLRDGPLTKEGLSDHHKRKWSHKLHTGEPLPPTVNDDFSDAGNNTAIA